jgi:hypothetical protein
MEIGQYHVCKSRDVPGFMGNLRGHMRMGRLMIQQDDMASRERVRWEPIGRTNPSKDQMTKRDKSNPQSDKSTAKSRASEVTRDLLEGGGKGER